MTQKLNLPREKVGGETCTLYAKGEAKPGSVIIRVSVSQIGSGLNKIQLSIKTKLLEEISVYKFTLLLIDFF